MRFSLIVSSLALAPVAIAAQEPAQEIGAAYARAFVDGDDATLWAAMDDTMRGLLGGPDALRDLRASLAASAGEETAILREETSVSPLGTIHDRVAQWSDVDMPLSVTVVTDADDRITGFWVGPAAIAAESRFLDYQVQANLHLPVEGEWTVFWGGRSPTENYHAVDPAQRFAADLVIARDGATHAGDAEDPSSYHCWDAPILAPAAGRVVAAVDGLSDQPIGQSDPEHPAGNHVVIEVGPAEYVFLAHLRADSVTVAAGDEIAAGEEIGRCGNSGNSTEPHLHIHLQTTADLYSGEGLPLQFQQYLADSQEVDRGEPRRGQVIAPMP